MSDMTPPPNPNRGRAPDPSELLMTVLGLTDTVIKISEEASATHDEAGRVLKSLEGSDEKLQTLGAQLQGMYAPDQVRQAAAASKEAVQELRRQMATLHAEQQAQARSSARLFWQRSAGAVAVGVVFLAVLSLGAMHFVPSLDEVKARRAEMAVQPMKPTLYEGHQWVPVSDVQSLCKNGKTDCANYGRID